MREGIGKVEVGDAEGGDVKLEFGAFLAYVNTVRTFWHPAE
jgi:hypothetical protein